MQQDDSKSFAGGDEKDVVPKARPAANRLASPAVRPQGPAPRPLNERLKEPRATVERSPSLPLFHAPRPPLTADVQLAEEEPRHENPKLLRSLSPLAVSLIVHTFVLVLLALWTLAIPQGRSSLIVTVDSVEKIDQLTEVKMELADPNLEEPVLAELPAVEVEEPAEPPMLDLMVIESLATATASSTVEGIAGSDSGISKIPKLSGANFFGAKARGKKFVFIVDNSNSMTGGRFETAVQELIKTVNELSSKQSFYVLFFSDAAYEMFHPRPTRSMVAATNRNKQRLNSWLYTVELCLHTRGEAAVGRAIAMKPDAIFILGDGAFTDNTTQLLTGRRRRGIPVHCLGMEVKEKGRRQLAAIARSTGGTYRPVRVTAEAKKIAAQRKLTRNRTRGVVWGVALPKQEKRKKKKKP